MPRGHPVNWTREQLVMAQGAAGDAVWVLAQQLGVKRDTVYSMQKRIRDQGIDAILHAQEHRYETYVAGGNGRSSPATLEEQLRRVYNISSTRAGRGGDITQYSLTLPSRVAEQWVAKFGRQVRFMPTDEGLLVVPVEIEPPGDLPAWLEPDGS